MLPGYAFIKTHKVGGTTVEKLLQRALPEAKNVTQCDSRDPSRERTCRSCLTHTTYVPIARAIRDPASKQAQSVVRSTCPFWVPGRRVLSMIMLREPVDRAYSHYHFERDSGWCRTRADGLGLNGCASDHLPFADWLMAPSTSLRERRLLRAYPLPLLAETVHVLGGEMGFFTSLRVLKTITVVGVTDRFNDTLTALARGWDIPLGALKKHSVPRLVHTKPRDELNHSYKAHLEAHNRFLHLENKLYQYAVRRLDCVVGCPQGSVGCWCA
jgi:hypothetical protein